MRSPQNESQGNGVVHLQEDRVGVWVELFIDSQKITSLLDDMRDTILYCSGISPRDLKERKGNFSKEVILKKRHTIHDEDWYK